MKKSGDNEYSALVTEQAYEGIWKQEEFHIFRIRSLKRIPDSF